jgi:hypothetical protein
MTKVPSDNQAMPPDKEPIPGTKPRYKPFIEHMHSWGYLSILLAAIGAYILYQIWLHFFFDYDDYLEFYYTSASHSHNFLSPQTGNYPR